jgi:hypothetical protein
VNEVRLGTGEPRQLQSFADQRVQPFNVPFYAFQLAREIAVAALSEPQGDLQSRKWCSQVLRNVAKQRFL